MRRSRTLDVGGPWPFCSITGRRIALIGHINRKAQAGFGCARRSATPSSLIASARIAPKSGSMIRVTTLCSHVNGCHLRPVNACVSAYPSPALCGQVARVIFVRLNAYVFNRIGLVVHRNLSRRFHCYAQGAQTSVPRPGKRIQGGFHGEGVTERKISRSEEKNHR